MKCARILLGFLLVCAVGSTAWAEFVAAGDPEETGSWSVNFQENGNYNNTHYSFNDFHFVIMTGSGQGFESPGASAAGWTLQSETPVTANIAGPTVSSGLFTFTLKFAGTTAQPVVVWGGITLNGALEGGQVATWNGSTWSYVERSDQPLPAVPAPAALFLAIAGIGLVGMMRRRFQK